MTERSDANLFEVLIGQVAEYREINVVLGKSLGILPEPQRLKPVRNLLHLGKPLRNRAF
jgi:hypothetical protein